MGSGRERVKILLLSANDEATSETLVASFARAAKLEPSQMILRRTTEHAPDASSLAGMDAVFITGAAYSVFETVPNQGAVIALIMAAKEKRVPMLGVCYGAQLLAKTFGGEVIRDNAKSEWGTFDVESSDESFGDIVFADAPFVFPVMQAHQDRISKAPPSATVLALNARSSVQSFVIPGSDIYGFQFHPERSVADYEARLVARGAAYAGKDATPEQIRATLKETPDAEHLVATFVDRIIIGRK